MLFGQGAGPYATVAQFSTFELTAAPNGAWPSWNQAVYDAAVNTSLWGTITSSGSVRINAKNHTTGTVTSTEVGVLSGDQHNSPAIVIRESDGKYVVAMCDHNGAAMYINISTNAHDSTSWTGTTNIDAQLGGTAYTYPSLFQLEGETGDPMFLFFRNIVSGVSRWSLSRSTNGGVSWTNASAGIASGTRWYGRMTKSTSTRLDIAFTNGSYAPDFADVYHCYYEAGNYHDSAGATISEPLNETNMTQIYDGSAGGARFPNDVFGDGTNVAISFPIQTGTPGAVIAVDGDYIQARREGAAAWVNKTVASNVGMTTVDFTEGGISIDPKDWNRVAASVRVSGTWRMHLYTTTNSGTSWTATQITSSGSEDRYPWWVRDYVSGLLFVWQKGTFTSETSFNVAVHGYGVA
jgi:hypothetical protein